MNRIERIKQEIEAGNYPENDNRRAADRKIAESHYWENMPWLVKMVEEQAELIRDARAIMLPKGYSNAEITVSYVQNWAEKERALLAELEKK